MMNKWRFILSCLKPDLSVVKHSVSSTGCNSSRHHVPHLNFQYKKNGEITIFLHSETLLLLL